MPIIYHLCIYVSTCHQLPIMNHLSTYKLSPIIPPPLSLATPLSLMLSNCAYIYVTTTLSYRILSVPQKALVRFLMRHQCPLDNQYFRYCYIWKNVPKKLCLELCFGPRLWRCLEVVEVLRSKALGLVGWLYVSCENQSSDPLSL